MQIFLNSVLVGTGLAIGALVGTGLSFCLLAIIGGLLGRNQDGDN